MEEDNKKPLDPPQDGEKKFESTKLEESNKKSDEYLNNWKRAAADLANYKKEEMERLSKLMQYGKEDMIEKVLPIFDSIYLLEKHAGQVEGIDLIKKQITDFLKKEGVEEIKCVGEKFNPETMEIVEEMDGGESGMVTEELQKGYMMGEKVLRPAKVKVNK